MTNQGSQVLFSSYGRGWRGLDAAIVSIPRGLAHLPASETHVVGISLGPPVTADCACDGRRVRRIQRPGDIGFVPAGADSSWEDDAQSQLLRLDIRPELLDQVAADLGRNPAQLSLMPHLQLRDARMEAIGWAIRADLEADAPSDALYIDHLATALAVRIIETSGDGRAEPRTPGGQKLSARQLKELTDFIEMNLHRQLHLADLAAALAVSITRLKTLFRNSTGTSVHQYVIRRRIENARAMLATTNMPASEIALATGFTHQSHMASSMRRILGLTPSEISRP